MSEKGIGSKLLGLFVEEDNSGSGVPPPERGATSAAKTAAELVAELAQSSAAAPAAAAAAPSAAPSAAPAAALKLEPSAPPADGKPVDFDAIFREAGMDAAELDRVKKAEELLKSLPIATPQPVKRQIVEASLKAFGFEGEKIPAAAQNQLRALDAYVRVNEAATAKAVTEAHQEIQRLNEEIARRRAEIDQRNAALSALAAQAQGRKTQVQQVIEFFQAPAAPAQGS